MKPSTLLYVVPLIFVMLSGCGRIQGPEFRKIERFRVKNFGLSEATIGFNVDYYNPNGFGVTAKEAHVDVFIDSLFLGTFTSDSAVTVHRAADFSIPFTGVIPLQKVLQLKLPDYAKRDVLIRADGGVKVGKAGLFINEPIHYEGKHSLYELGNIYGSQ